MNIFYIPEIRNQQAFLDENESGHAIKVLRLSENDAVIVVDGKGTRHEGIIENAHHKKCLIRITSSQTEFEKRGYRLHLAVAPTKNTDRMEWLLEKATEIGIDEYTPLLCRFSERKNSNKERLLKIAVAAMKQSIKAYIPEIHDITPFEKFVHEPFQGKKFIAHCYPGIKLHLKHLIVAGENVLIMIGPEGDFSTEEVAMALKNGFSEISLGNARLRTETAALVACHTISLINS